MTHRLRQLVSQGSPDSPALEVPDRSHVYNCGDRADDIYLVVSGRLKAVGYAETGKSCFLGMFGPGDLFGEACLIEAKRGETVTAMRPAVLRRMSAAIFLSVLTERHLHADYVRYLVARIAEQQRAITHFATLPSEQRLSATLLSLCQRFGRQHPAGVYVDARLTQEELAGMVGTTRSRVGLFLKAFGDQGLVRTVREGFIVTDRPRLAAHAGIALPDPAPH